MIFNELDSLLKKDELKKFLLENRETFFESTLFRVGFPNLKVFEISNENLYKYHFVLFHFLYEFQEELSKQNLYLHIHFMRIRVYDVPSKDECRFFDETKMTFCKKKTSFGDFCEIHKNFGLENSIEDISGKYFYRDKSNFEMFILLDDSRIETARNMIFNHSRYLKSLEILGATSDDSIEEIKLKFRKLILVHHPDKNEDLIQKFIEINNAYRFILKILNGFQ